MVQRLVFAIGFLVLLPCCRVTQRDYLESARKKSAAGDHRGAVDDYTRAHEMSPDDPFVLKLRADEREKAGDAKGATADRAKSEEITKKKKTILRNLVAQFGAEGPGPFALDEMVDLIYRQHGMTLNTANGAVVIAGDGTATRHN